MDGTLGDRFLFGRRVRPATLEYASENYPRLVMRLKQGRLLVSSQSSPDDPETLLLYSPGKVEDRWLVLRSDFDILKKIADESVLRLFPSDTERDILRRIKARVELDFSGRGVPK